LSNTASGAQATVGGGFDNTASGDRATVPGGRDNRAEEDYSFAAGRNTRARATGAFVWGDSSTNTVESTTTDEVVFQAGGGVTLWSASDFSAGVQLGAGGGSWGSLSSRSVKTDVEPVDPGQVLDGVCDLTVSRWEYDSPEDATHVGPMAEEFYRVFGLGPDDEHITGVDADGVALGAIQGLARKLEQKDDRIDDLESETDDLWAENDAKDERIDVLETEVEALRAENESLRERLNALEDRFASPEAADD
jgi:FtsZ-binding cell division protein ZapB